MRRMTRGFLLSLLTGVMLALAPLAYATPPDQTWIAGLYDNADYDDVVLLVTAGAELVGSAPPHDLGLLLTVVELVPLDDESRPATSGPSSNPARAPPVV